MIELGMFSYNIAYTIISDILHSFPDCINESKQSFYAMKNPLIINLKGKLHKPFHFFLDACSLVGLKYHLVLSCGGIAQFSCDNRSQQHVEAIYGSFDFIGPTRTF